ncbi:MAG: HAD-IB family phosphatase [Pseudonocardia sp.]|nr:HAD-IB family phosphatase [Pseudonocardia sp.]
MTRLHVFDMDGTLLRGAATVELSRHLGTYDVANAVEQAWLRKEISDLDFWDRVLPLWADATEAELDAAFAAAAWIGGVQEVFADIAARGEHSAVISQSPHFFVRRLEGWGAHRTFGAGVVPGGRSSTDLLLTAQHKVDITAALLDELGIEEAGCVAYGDSTSDVLLFERLRHTVGVNPAPVLRDRAAVVYDGQDLREAYALGRGLLDGASAANRS